MKRLGAVAVLAVAVTGCASTVGGSGRLAAPPSTSTPPSSAVTSVPPVPSSSAATPSGSAPARWGRFTDRPTGVSFRLPGVPQLQRRAVPAAEDGTPLASRTYLVGSDADQSGVSVSVESATPVRAMRWRLSSVPNGMRAQFVAAGARDFAILERHSTTVSDAPALSFRIRFTARDGSGRRSVWFVTAVDGSTALVLVQTIGFASPAAESSALAAERRVHARVVASLDIP